MTDHTAKRAREIYLQLSTLDQSALEAELDRLSGGDAKLKDAVVSLIDAQARADRDDFMSSPTAGTTAMSAAITESAGSVIGRYKLLQLIGEGGFGSVFLAEQAKPVRRRVALKIIKLGMDTKQVIARFEAERQALAMMDHPHIARVYDAGATDTGRPYFAMEYVVGDAITKFADAHRLGIPERLKLFAQVCSAVQHAHTKGVIHRDLKPANVLVSMVDGKPFAKVIDFGIAKATASPLTEKTLFTEHRQLIGTPEYMSPEQAEGSPDIDTRTDVYALGVLLYELLTGVTPFDAKRLRSAAFGEMQRIIKEEDPPAPSMRLTRNLESLAQTAIARQIEPAKLSTAVRGELDWIVMKALDKDRARRYESAAQFSADVGRHLSGEPVQAAPPSRVYRVRKLMRRNKGMVIAGSVITATLLLGIAGTSAGLFVANHNFRAATHNANLALESRDAAEWSAYTANLALAQLAMDAGNYPEARKRLAECPEGKRGWEWTFANLRCNAVTSRFKLANDWIFSPTDSRLATFSADIYAGEQDILVFENTDFETPIALSRVGRWDVMQSARWSPDGERILLISSDGGLQFFNADGTGEPRVLSDSAHIREAEWNSDGSRLLTVSNEGVHVRQPDGTGKQLITLNEDPKTIRHAAWNPHNDTFAVLYSSGRIDTIDPDTHEAKTICPASGTHGWSMKWSPDGSRIIAYASDDSTPILLGHIDGSEYDEFQLAQPAAAICASWSPDGSNVIIGCSDRTATIVDINNSTTRQLVGMHSWNIFDVAWSNDGETVYTSSFNGICAWDPSACMPLGFITNGSEHPWHITAIPNSQSLIARNRYAENEVPATLVVPSEAWNTPDQYIRQNLGDMPYRLYVDAIASSVAQDPLSGLTLLTPDGTRRIEAQGRTLRFYDQPTGREVATHGFDQTITNLLMTGDGSQLVIELAKTAPRVWDIRTQGKQADDIQDRWRERVPAGEYLDTLWDSQSPTDSLLDQIIADQSLKPLRRLVAAEMLNELLTDMQSDANHTFQSMLEDAKRDTDAITMVDTVAIKSHLLAAARELDLPTRTKSLVLARAQAWEYRPPEASAEEELEKRKLAEALALARAGDAGASADEMNDWQEAMDQALAYCLTTAGPRHPTTMEVLRTFLGNGGSLDPKFESSALWSADLELKQGRPDVALGVAAIVLRSRASRNVDHDPISYLVIAMASKAMQTWNKGGWLTRAEDLPGISGDTEVDRAHDALSKARAIMADPTALNDAGVPWSQDPDAVALLAEAEALVEGASVKDK